MLEIINIICFGAIGFGIGGIGGIAFMNKDAKSTIKLYGKFKREKKDEILQIREKQEFQVQQLTKENTELQKQCNKALRNIELLQIKSAEEQIKIYCSIDEEIDEILNYEGSSYNMENEGQIENEDSAKSYEDKIIINDAKYIVH